MAFYRISKGELLCPIPFHPIKKLQEVHVMSNFFSFLVDETHHPYYFTHAQRLSQVKFPKHPSLIPTFDNHASIAEFYGIDVNSCNWYVYNPFTDELSLTQQNIADDEAEALSFVHSINWYDFCGDIEGLKKFIAALDIFPFLQNNPDFDLNGCKLFPTLRAAEDASCKAPQVYGQEYEKDAANNASYHTACHAERNPAWLLALRIVHDAVLDFASVTENNSAITAAYDIALYAATHYVCAGLHIPKEHADYINKLYDIWQNGYGSTWDVNGIFYIYRREEFNFGTPSVKPYRDRCNFFSFLTDENHRFYYFSSAQRLSQVKLADGSAPSYDAHADIAKFYGINENSCNQYEYNPFTDRLILFCHNIGMDKAEALSFVHSIHWDDFCGDIDGARKFLSGIKDIPFLVNNPNFDLSDCKVFDTENEAGITAGKVIWDSGTHDNTNSAWTGTMNYAQEIVQSAAMEPAYLALQSAAEDAVYDAVGGSSANIAEEMALYCVFHYLCANLPLAQKHLDHINKRLSIWQNGYGICCDVAGTFYVYRDL